MENKHLNNGTLLQDGRYKIERFINSGGFGCTYEATYSKFKSRVAVKEFFISDFCNRDEKTCHVSVATLSKTDLVEKLKGKFLDEAKAIYLMHEKHPQKFHPHIIRVIDFFEENGTAYYVMDYIDGKSLNDIVKENGALPEHKALKYIRQIADALKYVHSNSRLHLDVKPANIMIDGHDNAILIDFGASKHYDEGSGEETSTFMGINTKGYAPVEQQNGSLNTFCPATDIYALGATLYKLLTGITPPDAVSLMSKENTLKPLPDYISMNIRNAVNEAMQLFRVDRPQNIDSFLKLLDNNNVIDAHVADATTDLDSVKVTNVVKVANNETREKSTSKNSSKDNKKKLSKGFVIAICVVVFAVIVGIIVVGFSKGSTQLAHDDMTSPDYNGHEYVDLGLSVKWATCNVGASSPSDYGNYYAWGETVTKSDYSEDNCFTYNENVDDIAGDSLYDVACNKWGGSWRLPSKDEFDELLNCQLEWTVMNGHKGYKITGLNGNSIFLPAAGMREGNQLRYEGDLGRYWGSTPYTRNDLACYLLFDFKSFFRDWNFRSDGFSVRPVSP
ncbi:MAG: protein kinase [Prevotella sp.]|nr:protein kinase [Prevotella sp.]